MRSDRRTALDARVPPRLARLRTRGLREAPLLLQMGALLVIARIIVHVPFRYYARLVGSPVSASGSDPGTGPQSSCEDGLSAADGTSGDRAGGPTDRRSDERVARRAAWAVRAICGRFSSLDVCLPQALAAKWCLRVHGFDSTLHLGVMVRPGADRIVAHAWLVCGDVIVTGSRGSRGAIPMTAFR